MKIALGADHAGYPLKVAVAKHLAGSGHEVADHGTDSEAPVDYPAFCAAVGRAVVNDEADLGIVFGGSGQGEQIAANKVRGVRAALCWSELSARLARQHNDANVLALGGRLIGETWALAIVDAFLEASFEGGRHQRRIDQITDLETS
jgi:ribose 5-phosphate isomerase B